MQRYGIEPGDPVVLEPSDSGIVVRPLDAVIREVQAYFADVAPPGVSLSEELLQRPPRGSKTGRPWLRRFSMPRAPGGIPAR